MIKLTIELDSEKQNKFLNSFIKQTRFVSKAHIMNNWIGNDGVWRAKIQFEEEDTFLEFVLDWYMDIEFD